MRFEEADAKMAELFPGNYRDVKFHLTTDADGKRKPECALYLDGGYHTHYWPTWELAFAELEKMVSGAGDPDPFAQAPQSDAAEKEEG